MNFVSQNAAAARPQELSTAISEVDGGHGRLIYRGYTIEDLAGAITFEEVAHLLWFGQLPTRAELRQITEQLAAARTLPQYIEDIIRSFPVSARPIDVLAAAVAGLAPSSEKPTIDDVISITAKIPIIVALFANIRENKTMPAPQPQFSHIANYLYLLNGSVASDSVQQAVAAYSVLLADHGMNASTYTARIIASTGADMASAVSGAIHALKGPLHGGAPSLTLEMLQAIQVPENADLWIENELAAGKRIMGIGHRVYKTFDPRAEILRKMAQLAAEPAFFHLAETVEQTALRKLHERENLQRLWTNVEFYSAVVLNAAGIQPDLMTPTFAIARTAGYTAHILEQTQKTNLIRPESIYTGPQVRQFTALDHRQA